MSPAQGFAKVRLHGEGTRARTEDYRRNGVPVRPEEWAKVEKVRGRVQPHSETRTVGEESP